jgi:DnaJ family protein C protein 19
MKLLVLAALAVFGWRLVTGRWPPLLRMARAFGRGLRSAPPLSTSAPAEARTLFGLAPGADRAQILAAHRAMIGRVHPDRGGTADAVHEANAARDLLLAEAAWERR